jgi:hypothetical protein
MKIAIRPSGLLLDLFRSVFLPFSAFFFKFFLRPVSQLVSLSLNFKLSEENAENGSKITPSQYKNRRSSFFYEIFLTKVQFPLKIPN